MWHRFALQHGAIQVKPLRGYVGGSQRQDAAHTGKENDPLAIEDICLSMLSVRSFEFELVSATHSLSAMFISWREAVFVRLQRLQGNGFRQVIADIGYARGICRIPHLL